LLIEREVILAEDVERIFGKRPWASRSDEILDKTENPRLEEKEDTTETKELCDKNAVDSEEKEEPSNE
jgi:cell division protease FtsH